MKILGKYVVFQSSFGIEYPVLFPNHFVEHCAVKSYQDKAVSAGFFSFDFENVHPVSCYGHSQSLKLKSRKEDEKLILKQFTTN